MQSPNVSKIGALRPLEKKIRKSSKWHPMVGDGWRAGLTLDTLYFLGGDGGRGCDGPICHLNFATEVPDLCWVLRGPVEFEELSRGGADSKESSTPTLRLLSGERRWLVFSGLC